LLRCAFAGELYGPEKDERAACPGVKEPYEPCACVGWRGVYISPLIVSRVSNASNVAELGWLVATGGG
jgi:hypothetical protein